MPKISKNMTSSQQKKVHTIIHGASASAAAGLTELIGWTAANDFANETETLDKNAMEIIDKRVGDAANSLKKTKKTDTTKKKGFFKRK